MVLPEPDHTRVLTAAAVVAAVQLCGRVQAIKMQVPQQLATTKFRGAERLPMSQASVLGRSRAGLEIGGALIEVANRRDQILRTTSHPLRERQTSGKNHNYGSRLAEPPAQRLVVGPQGPLARAAAGPEATATSA